MGRRLTIETFIAKSIVLHGNKFDYSDTKYKNNRSYVTIICPIHGKIQQLAKSHLIGSGCVQCENKRKTMTTNDFICKAINVHGSTYDYSKVCYNNAYSEIIVICNIHGEFKQRASAHLEGAGCKLCSCSQGEKEIERYLLKYNFIFKREFSFPDLKGNYDFLRFDFAIFNSQGGITQLIEYDGIQHFKFVKTLHKTKDGFLLQKKYDKLKNDYCKVHKIKLIRISYRKKNTINDILLKKIGIKYE